MTETTTAEPTIKLGELSSDAPTYPRPEHPRTPGELLRTLYLTGTPEQSGDLLRSIDGHGFELARKAALDPEQRARADALRVARQLVESRTPISNGALVSAQISELVPLARFILTGSEFELSRVRELTPEEAVAYAKSVDGGTCPGGC